MKRSTPFSLLVIFVVGAFALSACGGAINPRGINLNDLNPNALTGIAHAANQLELTGTPGAHFDELTETPGAETETPESHGTPQGSETPESQGTPESHGTPESDNAHVVLGVVNAIDLTAGTITVNNVTYDFTSQSVIHGSIQVGDTVRLTFGNSNGTLIVHEVKVTNPNGSSNGLDNGQGQGSEGNQSGNHGFGTPEPGGNGGGPGDGGGE